MKKRNARILCVITARGGSKGLPGKNIRVLHGKPLLAWTIEQAQKCRYISDIFVTTDSDEIAAISKKYGQPVPELRPSNLAADDTSSMDVLRYCLDYYEKRNEWFDYLLLLEPTSPLRKSNDLDCLIELAMNNPNADGVISVGEVHTEHPLIVKKVDDRGYIRPYEKHSVSAYQRQMFDSAFFPYGVGYLVKVSVFNETNTIYNDNMLPYYIERWQNFEIDDLIDFVCVERIMELKREWM